MKISHSLLQTVPTQTGFAKRGPRAAFGILALALLGLSGCAVPQPAPPPVSAFDQSLSHSVDQIAQVTQQLRENQGNPPLNQYNGFPMFRTVRVPAALHDSRIALPPTEAPQTREIVRSPRLPEEMGKRVTLHVRDMPIDSLMNLLAGQIHWMYAHNGEVAGLNITLQVTNQPMSRVLQYIAGQIEGRASLKVDPASRMILLKVGD